MVYTCNAHKQTVMQLKLSVNKAGIFEAEQELFLITILMYFIVDQQLEKSSLLLVSFQ